MNSIAWDLNWFDFIILAVIVLSVIVSFFRGFIREAISLVTWIVAVILALKFSSFLADQFSTIIHSAHLRYVVAFVIIFLVVLTLGHLVNLMIRFLINKVGIGLFDRLLGVLFGAARGILLIAVVLMLLQVSGLKNTKWLSESRLAPRFQPLVSWLNEFVPQKIESVSKWLLRNPNEVS